MATRFKALVAFIKRTIQWWNESRGGRALSRYNQAAGALLCGGIAYTAVFSIFAALVISYTALTMIVGANDQLRDQVFSAVNQFIPGLVDTGDGGVLTVDQLLLTDSRGITSLIAGAVLLWTAVSFIGGIRTALQSVLHTEVVAENPIIAKAKDFGGYLMIFVSIVLTTAVSATISLAGSWLHDRLGHTALTLSANVLGLIVVIAVDIAVFAYVVIVLGRIRPPKRDLLVAGGAVAVVVEVLRTAGGQIVAGSASKNALLASFAVIVTLLLVVNLVARITLMAAAWLAEGKLVYKDDDEPRRSRRTLRTATAGPYVEGPTASLPKPT